MTEKLLVGNIGCGEMASALMDGGLSGRTCVHHSFGYYLSAKSGSCQTKRSPCDQGRWRCLFQLKGCRDSRRQATFVYGVTLDSCGRPLDQPEASDRQLSQWRVATNNLCKRLSSQHFTSLWQHVVLTKLKTTVRAVYSTSLPTYRTSFIFFLIIFSDWVTFTLSFMVTMPKWFIFRIAQRVQTLWPDLQQLWLY